MNNYGYLDSILVNIEDLFAFHYNPNEEDLPQAAGWMLYNASVEYSRMEVPTEYWVQTKLNKDYKVSISILL